MIGVSENVEHVILNSNKYAAEREQFQERVRAAGREWSLTGLLGTEREAGGRSLFSYRTKD